MLVSRQEQSCRPEDQLRTMRRKMVDGEGMTKKEGKAKEVKKDLTGLKLKKKQRWILIRAWKMMMKMMKEEERVCRQD